MASRMSMAHPMVEELRHSSPTSSSPLRRRSSIARKTMSSNLEENDDEAERLARRVEKNQSAAARNDTRRSLGLGFVAQMSNPQINERISQCIKLSAENKINIKNAFSLELIDFMTYMIKKQDLNMSDLKVASTSLDVSTKIYGFRVDGVHTEILKMVGSKDKQEKGEGRRDSRGGAGDDLEGALIEADAAAEARAKRKRKSKQKIHATAESLRGNVETVNPASWMFNQGDSQTTDLLYQAILPHHANSGLHLNTYNDVTLDNVDPNFRLSVNPMPCTRIDNLDRDSVICPLFANFEFLGWSAEEEIDLTPEKSQPIANNDGFQFDLDASLPPDEEATTGGLNYFDMEDEADNENVEGCRGPVGPTGNAANIVDFSQVIQASRHNQNSEYSYLNGNLDIQWAGPSHWKIRHAARHLGGSRIVEGCGQEAVRRRKELLLAYDNATRKACDSKFDIARGNLVKLQAKTANNYWSEEKLTLPQDMHYDPMECCKFYLRPGVVKKFTPLDGVNATRLSDEIADYDYNNANDTTDYCPNIGCDEQQQEEHQQQPASDDCPNNAGEFEGFTQAGTQAFTGDNLVEAPKVNNKIFISFTQRAKKIDMRQLKKCIWKCLTGCEGGGEKKNAGGEKKNAGGEKKNAGGDKENVDKENVDSGETGGNENLDKIIGTKNFSDVYKKLPNILSKANTEALSCPIAFMSLLHLANEKNLKLVSNDDLSDIFVQQD